MLRSLVLTFWLAVFAPHAARADTECKQQRDFERDEGKGLRKYVDIFSFRKDRRGDSVLMLFKDGIERGVPPKQWLFLHKPSADAAAFCVMGRGEGFGQHDDHPETQYHADFGEGHARCATSTAALKAPEALRAYANRTLGDDIVLYAEGVSGSGFQFAIGPEHDWIIIEDKVGSSCVFDSGTDVLMRYNVTVPVD